MPPHASGAEDGGGLLGPGGGVGVRGDLLPRAQGHSQASLQGVGDAVLEAVLGVRGGGRGIEGGDAEDGTSGGFDRKIVKCFFCGFLVVFWFVSGRDERRRVVSTPGKVFRRFP